jgi:hypothetical protein
VSARSLHIIAETLGLGKIFQRCVWRLCGIKEKKLKMFCAVDHLFVLGIPLFFAASHVAAPDGAEGAILSALKTSFGQFDGFAEKLPLTYAPIVADYSGASHVRQLF